MNYEIDTYTQQAPTAYVEVPLPGGRVKIKPDPDAVTVTEHVADVYANRRRVSTHIAATSSGAMTAAKRWCDGQPEPEPAPIGRITYSPTRR